MRRHTDVNESPSCSLFSSFKHHYTKARSLRKAKNALPNNPQLKEKLWQAWLVNSKWLADAAVGRRESRTADEHV